MHTWASAPIWAQVNRCLSIKGAEDILNKPHAFEVSTTDDSMFFIADTDKVCAAPQGTCRVSCIHTCWGINAIYDTDCCAP